MSRLWGRVGVRALAVALLVVGVFGGVYLGHDRATQQQGIDVSLANQAELADMQLIKQRYAERLVATAQRRAAERIAAEKAAAAAKAAAERARRAEQEASRRRAERSSTSNETPNYGPIPASCSEYSGNRATGCAELLKKGFGLDQMPCLDKLWEKESGWHHRSLNTSSGAYGIPQALPGSKMATAGADWETNPATQIRWGLGYIKNRYGTPCKAWQHSLDTGWY